MSSPKVMLSIVGTILALPWLMSAAAHAGPAQTNGPFQGDWDVRWCRAGESGGDCGGLSVLLFQSGTTLCGTYSGATPGLAQVDDGEDDAVLGQVVGRVAILAVRGGRSGEVKLVRAELKGSKLRWRVLHSVSPPIDDDAHDDTTIVGVDELLSKRKLENPDPSVQCKMRFGARDYAMEESADMEYRTLENMGHASTFFGKTPQRSGTLSPRPRRCAAN